MMYLSKLMLKNWRSHKDTTLEFGQVNLIRGGNNSGKSSIAQAIEYVLTGRCSGTDEAGRGIEGAISLGQASTTVAGIFKHAEAVNGASTSGITLSRTRNGAGSSVTMTYGAKGSAAGRQVAELLEKWGYPVDVMSAALRSGRFVSLDPKEQKELLADVLRPETVKLPEDIAELMDACGLSANKLDEVDLETVRLYQDMATKLRAGCTAALRELGEPEEVPEPQPGEPTREQISQKLTALIAEQMKLTQQIQKAESAWADRNARRRRLPEEIAKLEAAILPKEDEDRLMGVIADEAKIKKAAPELARVQAEIAEKRGQLAKIGQNNEKCPTCGQAADTEAIKKRLEEAIQAAASRIPTLEGLAMHYSEIAQARQRLEAHRAAFLDLPKLQKEAKDLGPIEDLPKEHAELTKQIEALSVRVKNGQERLADVSALAEKRNSVRVLLEQRRNLEIRWESADKLAKWAGPDGIQSQMTGSKLDSFSAQINAVLEEFGYACTFMLEPYGISVRAVGSDADLSLAALSESEQWRFGLGLQSAIAKVTGFGIVVCDRADVLSAANRGKLVKAMLGCGLQVIVCATADLVPLNIPGLKVFDLEIHEGKTTIRG